MNTSGPQTTAAHPSSAESNCLPLPCAFGAAEASDSIGGGEQKKNSNTYVSTESGEVHRAQGVPVIENERAPDRFREPVTVQVTNDNWLDVRIYVVETATYRGRWPLGNVTGLGTARFEIPDHPGAELGNLILVAEAMGSRQLQFTHRLHTVPGSLVDWDIRAVLGQSFATVF